MVVCYRTPEGGRQVQMKKRASLTLNAGKAVGKQAYEILRNQIIQGVLKPGTRISEADVSTSLQISRQPVREAFIRLGNDGLVEIRPQRGTYVTTISIEEVGAARFIREAVEADIIKLLVEKSNPEIVQNLRLLIKKQRELGEGCLEEFMEQDEWFHRSLAALAGKGRAWKGIAGTKAHFDRVRYLSSTQKSLGRLVDQHEAVVDAVESRDGAKAESTIRYHLQEVLRDLPNLVSQQPEFFT